MRGATGVLSPGVMEYSPDDLDSRAKMPSSTTAITTRGIQIRDFLLEVGAALTMNQRYRSDWSLEPPGS
jgi:hypothetical protein